MKAWSGTPLAASVGQGGPDDATPLAQGASVLSWRGTQSQQGPQSTAQTLGAGGADLSQTSAERVTNPVLTGAGDGSHDAGGVNQPKIRN